MSQLAVLKPEDIKSRVATSNSFTKLEMATYRAQITDERKAKRARLSTMTGSQLGTLVEEQMKSKGAVIKDIRTTTSAKQQTWFIKMTAPVHKTEAERLKDRAVKLAKQLNEVEEAYEAEKAKAESTEVVTTKV